MPATATPEIRSAAGRVASLSRDLDQDDPDLIDAQRQLREAQLAAHIAQVVASAPPLTTEQRDRLAELLRPARESAAS
ncbi:hypothetical protein ABQF33_17385 [Mycolicibacterium sp. XJ2]